jgi:hypothetical protein
MTINWDIVKNNLSCRLNSDLSDSSNNIFVDCSDNLSTFFPCEAVIWNDSFYEDPSADPNMERINVNYHLTKDQVASEG